MLTPKVCGAMQDSGYGLDDVEVMWRDVLELEKEIPNGDKKR